MTRGALLTVMGVAKRVVLEGAFIAFDTDVVGTSRYEVREMLENILPDASKFILASAPAARPRSNTFVVRLTPGLLPLLLLLRRLGAARSRRRVTARSIVASRRLAAPAPSSVPCLLQPQRLRRLSTRKDEASVRRFPKSKCQIPALRRSPPR